MKHVLILGAGRVARPCVKYLQKVESLELTVLEASRANLERVAGRHPRTTGRVQQLPRDTAGFIAGLRPDLVINLLPAEFCARVALACAKAEVDLVSPDYADATVAALGPALRKAGRTWLFELGVDPGIDHMCAARTIHAVHAQGGEVEAFRSVCGAIPSPEANNNPWGYKLSWEPESLLDASQRDARILVGGKVVEWPGGATYEHVFLEEVAPLGWFEVFANANALPYLQTYGIPEARAIFRGTLRHLGWCETMVAMNKLALFGRAREDFRGLTFRALLARLCGADRPEEAERAFCARLGLPPFSTVFQRMRWLGLFEERPIPASCACRRDLVRTLFQGKLVFLPSERDLVILKDEVVAAYPGGRRLRHTSTLIDYGVPGGDSSIARTTGLPPAIAARLLLEGRVPQAGVVLPILPALYEPILAELEREGIRLEERVAEL
jgi:saccharopine dehydrogenase-like NADP-dependent oxidoreductase